MVFNQLIGVEDVRLLLQHDAVIGAAGHHMEIGQYVSLVADDNAGTGFDTLLVLVKHFQHNHEDAKRASSSNSIGCRCAPVCGAVCRTGCGAGCCTGGAARSGRCNDARDRDGRGWVCTGLPPGRLPPGLPAAATHGTGWAAVGPSPVSAGPSPPRSAAGAVTGVCSTRWDRASNSADCTETSCSFPRYSTSQPNR